MFRFLPILPFVAGFLIAGCGSFNKEKDQSTASELIKSEQVGEVSTKEQQEKLVEAFKVLDKRMKKMVSTAKEGGPEAIEFLASDLFLKANDSSMRGDSHTAAYLYKQLLELKPNDYYVRKKYAVELIRLGSLIEAKLVLGDLLKESDYKEETLGLILGGVHTALNETNEAQTTRGACLLRHAPDRDDRETEARVG